MEILSDLASTAHLAPVLEERPLSYGQRALWFLDRLSPGNPAYVIAGAARARGLDAAALGRAAIALATATRRSARPFTSGRKARSSGWARRPDALLLAEDATALDGPGLARRLSEVAYRPFDLESGPLWRLGLLALAGGDQALVLSIHHIVSDFWSLAVLLRDLGALYGAALGIAAAELPEPATDFAQGIAEEEARLAGPEGERLWQFWRQALSGVPLVLDLPTDRPRPAVQTYRGEMRRFALAPGLAGELRRLTRRHGATLYMGLLAAFDVLLHRYSGQERLLVGCPTTGRKTAELAGLVGYLVNPVAIAADFRGDPGFGELLGRVRATALAAFAHQDYPLPLLAERLEQERSSGRTPIFQVMCVLQKGRRASERGLAALAVGEAGVRLDFGPLALESLALQGPGAQFDLSLALAETERGLGGRLAYNRDLFEAATAARLLSHFEVLLTRVASAAEADPAGVRSAPISGLSLLSPAERQQLLVEWNAPEAEYPGEGLVPERLAARAARAPGATALVLDGEWMSYGELDARAARIGRHLRALGVGPESRVGILAERSFAMVAALLGIWKAGGAYLPLDGSLPAERLAFMLADAEVAAVLVERHLAAALPDPAGPIPGPIPRRTLVLDALWDAEPPAVGETSAMPHLLPDHPAYVLYTSGSTGRPKGVVVAHRALDNRLRFVQAMDLAPGDSFLHKTTISFDASIAEIFGPLLVGGRTVLARPGGERDPGYLIGLLRQHEISHASFTMAMLSVLLKEHSLRDCPSLRTMVTGGETVPPDLPDRFHAQSDAELLNRYGPTEATISVTSWRCLREPRGRVIPIGRPIARAEIHLLDRDLQPVPIGVPGELCIAGVCLARGYLDRPALTAEKFIPCPFSPIPGGRLYRSGDLARFRPDGAIEFVGRIDSQVKVRGFRVELGEIEAALQEHPAVERSAVVDREEPGTGSRRLVAYFVPRPGRTVTPADLQELLQVKVPGYMMPAAFVALERLPLGPTGKVDRRALPEPAAGEPLLPGVAGEAPRGPLEELLAGIWADLLGVRPPGRQDNFFALGGHSLLATQATSRVRQALGVELPLKALFEAPTLAGFAAAVEAARGGDERSAQPLRPPLRPAPRGGPLALSFAQERLWFLDQLEPGLPSYNMPGAFDFAGPLDRRAFAASLGEIVRRHEALRTTFARSEEDRPVQVVAPADGAEGWRVPLVDLAGLPAVARGLEGGRLTREEARRPFDLARGPLLRTVLLRSGPEAHRALLTLHHVIADGWSVAVLVRELGALYAAFREGRRSPLPELAVQYADYARWQRGWLAGPALAAQLAWWRERLSGAPEGLDLPADRPRPAVPSSRGGRVRSTLPGEVAAALERLGRSRGATLYMTLLAGFSSLLARYTGQEDVVVGSPIANRTRIETEGLIGFFVNTLVLRTELPGDPPFGVLLRQVRESMLAAHAHQDLPFERLVEELSPERSLAHTPLFQVMLVLQEAVLGELRLPGLAVHPLPQEEAVARFDLLLQATPLAAGLAFSLEYSRDLFEEATAARLLGHLGNLLAGVAADPDLRLTALPLLGAAERQEVLRWSAGPVQTVGEERVHAFFEAQAERSPLAPAVEMDGELLSYAELEARANQLARHLQALGVGGGGRESAVGICLPRSLALPVAVLAVLKAGGVYVPLDPAYPSDRLALVMEDAGLAALLTTSPLLGRLPASALQGEGGVPLVLVDAEATAIAARSAARPRTFLSGGDSLTYVLYTSGSTGRPKGVAMPHRPLANMIAWQLGAAAPGRRTLQFASLSFDVSFQEMLSTWGSGGCLVLVSDELRRDPPALLRLLRERRVERLFLPFVALQQIAEAVADGSEVAGAPRGDDGRRAAPGDRRARRALPQDAGEPSREPVRPHRGARGHRLHPRRSSPRPGPPCRPSAGRSPTCAPCSSTACRRSPASRCRWGCRASSISAAGRGRGSRAATSAVRS